MRGNLLYGQSGGPTAVINSTAAGVFLEGLAQTEAIDRVYGAHHGIVGILEDDLFDLTEEDRRELLLLKQTPSSVLGSCRYKLADPEVDETDYARILEIFRKYNIRYFFYNGGNDSMDTCQKISAYLVAKQYECKVIGLPKTIDNDLVGTDHSPGYGSAARYIATTLMEIHQDATVYERGQITVVEIMGRNAGWLTAAASLAQLKCCGPDLLFLPEKPFNLDQVIETCRQAYAEKHNLIIALSEGVKTEEGKFLPELEADLATDAFGHKQMGGAAQALVDILQQHIPTKYRYIELSLMQRCSAHLASRQDVDEAFLLGSSAVQAAIAGTSDVMVALKRPEQGIYRPEICLVPLREVANYEKAIPLDWIKPDHTGMTQEFYDYALPLINGRPDLVLDEDGLPRFAHLRLKPVSEK
ncbi:MAG: 6-phosphofructokinase [Eubacteriales bacterium]|nr:6-phosphofructokinase [Eubacteriales bacterium]